MEKTATGFCKSCAKLMPLLLLVPVIRKLRARRQETPRRHFPLLGH